MEDEEEDEFEEWTLMMNLKISKKRISKKTTSPILIPTHGSVLDGFVGTRQLANLIPFPMPELSETGDEVVLYFPCFLILVTTHIT